MATGPTSKLPAHVKEELHGLGRRLEDVRLARGLSFRGVARVTDGALSANAVYRLECADRLPNITSLMALAMAYDCDIKINRNGTVTIHGTGLHTNGGMT